MSKSKDGDFPRDSDVPQPSTNDLRFSRRGMVGAIGSTAGLIALGCSLPTNDQAKELPLLGRTQQGLLSEVIDNGSILDSKLHQPAGAPTPWAEFKNLISSAYSVYELRLRNIYPTTLTNGSAFLALQLSADNGLTWDNASCSGSCYTNGHYSYTNSYTVPGSNIVSVRNSQNTGNGAGSGYDQQIALAQQDGHATGVCGLIRMYSPLAAGLYKQFEWETSYFRPGNFCRETGGGLYYGASNLNGSPYNAFRLGYTNSNGVWLSNFGGGGYALLASA